MRVAISEIVVPDGRRPLRPAHVAELAASIRELDLIEPIAITADKRLVAGLHRLEACKSLGWTDIPATTFKFSRLQADLAEIDENLVRSELTVLERCDALARRKDIYEALHPETRHGIAGALAGGKGRPKAVPESGTANRKPSFVEDTASKTNRSTQVIYEDLTVAHGLTPDVKEQVRDTAIADSKSKLQQLARLPAEKQREAVHSMLKKEEPAESSRPSKPARVSIPEGVDDSVTLALGAYRDRAVPFLASARKLLAEAKDLRRHVPVSNTATSLAKLSELVGLLAKVVDLADAATPDRVCPKCGGRKPFCGERIRCGGWVNKGGV